MKVLLLVTLLVGYTYAQEAPANPTAAGNPAAQSGVPVVQNGKVQYPVRDLPADVLRDFSGVCFASTTFRFYQVGESWPLAPFCGVATCMTDGFHLIERVRDCGLLPKANPKCKVVNEADVKLTFPKCCPRFECEEGVELEYPTPEELRQIAEEAHRAQVAANQARLQQRPQVRTGATRRTVTNRRPVAPVAATSK